MTGSSWSGAGRTMLHAINHLDSAHKSGDAWVRIASSVQAWIVVRWEAPRAQGADSYSCAFDSDQCAFSRRLHAPKRCVPRLAIINVWISKGFYLRSLQLFEEPIDSLQAPFWYTSMRSSTITRFR